MLKYRLLTIAVLLPLVLWLIFQAPIGLMRGVLGFLMCVAWWEWRGLSFPLSLGKMGGSILILIGLAVGTHLTLPWESVSGVFSIRGALWALTTCFWLFLSPYWLSKQWQLSPFWRLSLGSVLIASLFSAMAYLVHRSPPLFLSGMGLIWVSDCLAYVTGRLLGKHKLAPSISPGKTWEGALGGVLSAVVYAAFVLPPLLHIVPQTRPFWIGLATAALLAVLGILGDLWESLLKRQAGKKDSGSLLPGHGGILDRIDALFPVLPLVALLDTLGGYYHVLY